MTEIIAHIEEEQVTIEAEELVFKKPDEVIEEEEEIDEEDLMARFGYDDAEENIIRHGP